MVVWNVIIRLIYVFLVRKYIEVSCFFPRVNSQLAMGLSGNIGSIYNIQLIQQSD